MSYYYCNPIKKEFIDSSSRLEDSNLVQLNEQQYAITRLIIKGYSRKEIEIAIKEVFEMLDGLQE